MKPRLHFTGFGVVAFLVDTADETVVRGSGTGERQRAGARFKRCRRRILARIALHGPLTRFHRKTTTDPRVVQITRFVGVLRHQSCVGAEEHVFDLSPPARLRVTEEERRRRVHPRS